MHMLSGAGGSLGRPIRSLKKRQEKGTVRKTTQQHKVELPVQPVGEAEQLLECEVQKRKE